MFSYSLRVASQSILVCEGRPPHDFTIPYSGQRFIINSRGWTAAISRKARNRFAQIYQDVLGASDKSGSEVVNSPHFWHYPYIFTVCPVQKDSRNRWTMVSHPFNQPGMRSKKTGMWAGERFELCPAHINARETFADLDLWRPDTLSGSHRSRKSCRNCLKTVYINFCMWAKWHQTTSATHIAVFWLFKRVSRNGLNALSGSHRSFCNH